MSSNLNKEPRKDSGEALALPKFWETVSAAPATFALEVWWWFWYCSEELGPVVRGEVEKKVMHMNKAMNTRFVIAGGVTGSIEPGELEEDSYSSEASW